jgi:prepilin-type N-terminal cleavage/methylation domain-containing protein
MVKKSNWITEMINTKVNTSSITCFKRKTYVAGFTLVEMMISMVLLGTIMIGVYNLYLSQQKQNLIQEDVVELQQNLRVAMDNITRDMRMSGFLNMDDDPMQGISDSGGPSYGGLNDSDSVTLNKASGFGYYAKIVEDDTNEDVTVGTNIIFTVDSNGIFSVTTPKQLVRIIRPAKKVEVVVTTYTVEAVETTDAACSPKVAPCLILEPTTTFGSTEFKTSDIIARTGIVGSELYPGTMTYSLITGGECPAGQICIAKSINGGSNEIIASNITDLQLSYIDDGGNVVPNPADPSQVRAIVVTISGATARAGSEIGSTDNADFTVVNARIRQLSSIVRIRNR